MGVESMPLVFKTHIRIGRNSTRVRAWYFLRVVSPAAASVSQLNQETAAAIAAALSPGKVCRYSVQTLVVFMPASASVLVL